MNINSNKVYACKQAIANNPSKKVSLNKLLIFDSDFPEPPGSDLLRFYPSGLQEVRINNWNRFFTYYMLSQLKLNYSELARESYIH